MKKHYHQPIKLKRAVKSLVSFIDAYSGLRLKDRKDWEEEVAAVKSNVNPYDFRVFDKIVIELDVMGVVLAGAWDALDYEIRLFDKNVAKIGKNIK
jgi:hypothetical protein